MGAAVRYQRLLFVQTLQSPWQHCAQGRACYAERGRHLQGHCICQLPGQCFSAYGHLNLQWHHHAGWYKIKGGNQDAKATGACDAVRTGRRRQLRGVEASGDATRSSFDTAPCYNHCTTNGKGCSWTACGFAHRTDNMKLGSGVTAKGVETHGAIPLAHFTSRKSIGETKVVMDSGYVLSMPWWQLPLHWLSTLRWQLPLQVLSLHPVQTRGLNRGVQFCFSFPLLPHPCIV